MKKILVVLSLFVVISACAQNESTNKKIYPVAFYNVENLFDTIDDKNVIDEEFTPTGDKKWTKDKYQKKLNNIAFVLDKLGKNENPDGAVIIGLAEVENKRVLNDLINTKPLNKTGYKYVHYDSPDARGIDVALLYNPKHFKVTSSTKYPYGFSKNYEIKTRDHLLVSGILDGEPLHIIVNHWPSRRDPKSEAYRELAAANCKHITDSIRNADPKAKVVIMGDLNDDPQDKSCRVVLGAKKEQSEVQKGGLYNTMWKILESGVGTLCYREKWNLFDQIIISDNLLGTDNNSLKYIKSEVYNPDYLFQQSGRYKGYPLRTFSGNNFLNGYSDHLPTIIYLTK